MHHSWIITAHISLGDLYRQLHMFNNQKTLAHQLLVKLQRPTTHISLGDLYRQLHMLNCQKTLAHQILPKLQDQPLACQLVVNALLDDFLTYTASMNPTGLPHDQQCSYSKLIQKACHHLKTHDPKRSL